MNEEDKIFMANLEMLNRPLKASPPKFQYQSAYLNKLSVNLIEGDYEFLSCQTVDAKCRAREDILKAFAVPEHLMGEREE